MKKQIITLLFLICIAAGLAAETGYRGFEWGTSEFLFELKAGDEFETIKEEGSPFISKAYKAKLLGEERRLHFYFTNNMLCSAIYLIPAGQTNQLINNLEGKKLLAQVPTPAGASEQMTEGLKEYKGTEIQKEYLLGISVLYFCSLIDEADLSKLEKQEAENQIYIYNYNDDTRIYIYKNFIKDTTVVVYFPHEQDY